jgi:hypothetical protein
VEPTWDLDLNCWVKSVGRPKRKGCLRIYTVAAWDGECWNMHMYLDLVKQWNQINAHEFYWKLTYAAGL